MFKLKGYFFNKSIFFIKAKFDVINLHIIQLKKLLNLNYTTLCLQELSKAQESLNKSKKTETI